MGKNIRIEALLLNIAESIHDHEENDKGLYSGLGGMALYELTYGMYFNEDKFVSKGIYFIEKIFDDITIDMKDSFCSGLAGTGWLLNYLNQQQWSICDDIQSTMVEIDNFLIKKIEKYLHINYWDFLHGYIGIGYYLIQRVSVNKKIEKTIDLILSKLLESAIKDSENKIKWKAIINQKEEIFKINISLSHGMCGIIIFLLRLNDVGIRKREVRLLMEGSINYIFSQMLDQNKYDSFFPMFSLVDSSDFKGSRLSWCYGDLGICYTIWKAGIALNNEIWIDKALYMLSYQAKYRRKPEDIKDACFCHGTVGIAHIFYRMWLNTNNRDFKDAADYWFNETVKMSKFPNGTAGYKAYYDRDKGYVNQYDLLNGIAGIGLPLIYYYLGKTPDFDNCFLLS